MSVEAKNMTPEFCWMEYRWTQLQNTSSVKKPHGDLRREPIPGTSRTLRSLVLPNAPQIGSPEKAQLSLFAVAGSAALLSETREASQAAKSR
jgi:hypothetical protein